MRLPSTISWFALDFSESDTVDLPLSLMRDIADRRISEAGASPLFVTISGAHLYGFASPDSDFDVRGSHLMPLKQIVSLHPGEETIEYSGVEDGREIDLVSHDAGKFFRLMLKKNGYVMEQVFSPLVVIGGPVLEELRDIAKGCLTRHLVHHYNGFTENQLGLLEKEEPKRVKTLLYVYRVLLTGIHELTAGEIESNLTKLLSAHPQDLEVADLIVSKTREAAPLDERSLEGHLARIARLRGELDRAFVESRLPEIPLRARDLDAFLVHLRLQTRS
jgi:predicted nucleotidyltransferase